MIGRLISAATSHTTAVQNRGSYTFSESNIEEQHTAGLLFSTSQEWNAPQDGSARLPLHSPTGRTGYDDSTGLDLEENRDFRVIIAQDAVAGQDKPLVLLDTGSTDGATTSYSTDAFARSHSRAASGAIPPRNPSSPLADHNRSRSTSGPGVQKSNKIRSSTLSGSGLGNKSGGFRDADSVNALNSLLECMFGVSSSSKDGSSTKMHLINRSASTNASGSLFFSSTASSMQQKQQNPARPRTTGPVSLGAAPSIGFQDMAGEAVLVTRTFNVDLPDIFVSGNTNTTSAPLQAIHGSSTDTGANGDNATTKAPKLRETKTPAFAVALVINLPRLPRARPISKQTRPSSPSPWSVPSQSSSFGSEKSWNFVDFLPKSPGSEIINEQFDTRLELLMSHWDIIVRALFHLENHASKKIMQLLRQVEENTRTPQTKMPKEKATQRTNQKIIYLPAGCLATIPKLRALSLWTIRRVASALRIIRANTGQGLLPGGHWLEEARLIKQKCHNRSQTNFLYTILTAFLGDHLEWTRMLKILNTEIQPQPTSEMCERKSALRTVIVCNNRSLARRVLFLVASFLPSSAAHQTHAQGLTARRSVASLASFTQQQQSPSRQLNRPTPKGLQISLDSDQRLSTSLVLSEDHAKDSLGTGPGVTGSRPRVRRKVSETPSSHVVGSLPIPMNDTGVRKTSATIGSSESPDGATPTPYFVSGSKPRNSYFPSVDSADQLGTSASSDLMRLLRSNSNNFGSSTASTKWGSLLGGFWGGRSDSTKRPGSTTSTYLSEDAIEDSTFPYGKQKPNDMADTFDSSPPFALDADTISVTAHPDDTHSSSQKPLPMAVDETDGVVDVVLDLPGFWPQPRMSGGEPRSSRSEESIPALDIKSSTPAQSLHAHTDWTAEKQEPLRVAGYLRRYHGDFALQAVAPYDSLLEEIKQSMKLEVTPPDALSQARTQDDDGYIWVEVCSTLIADMAKLSVLKLTLRRKFMGSLQNPSDAQRSESHNDRPPLSPISRHNSIAAEHLEEIFDLVKITEYDETLARGIDRALGDVTPTRSSDISTPPSQIHSRTASTSTTRSHLPTPGGTESNADSLPRSNPPTSQPTIDDTSSSQDPRKVVVSALAEVVKSVNENLHRQENGQDVQVDEPHNTDSIGEETRPTVLQNGAVAGSGAMRKLKEENALREGVKRWLMCVNAERDVW